MSHVIKPLKLPQYIAYAAPSMAIAFLFSSLGIIQGIYAKHFGMALSSIALVLLVSRLFDAVTDPLIGYFSDRYRARSGTRKPFVVVGGLFFIVSSYFLYVPINPDNIDSSTTVSTPYFLGWFLAFYFAWTLLEIPHLAWGAELAPSSKAKNKIYSLRSMATYLGILLFYLVPLLPFFETNEFTPQTLQWAVVAAGLMMIVSLYFCVRLTPKSNGIYIHSSKCSKKESIWVLRREIINNKPFLLFIVAFFLFGVGGSGMWFTLKFIFVDAYLGLGKHFALLSLVGICASLVAIGFWYWLASHLGKKIVWGLGMLLYALGIFGASFLEPGQASIVALSVIMVLVYVGSTPINAISPSLLADIIDYSSWKFGSDHTATYFSLYMLVLKASLAVGGSLGLGLASWYGFDPAAVAHRDEHVFGLRLSISWIPAGLLLLSILVMALVPINGRRHAVIRRRLDTRISREMGVVGGTCRLIQQSK